LTGFSEQPAWFCVRAKTGWFGAQQMPPATCARRRLASIAAQLCAERLIIVDKPPRLHIHLDFRHYDQPNQPCHYTMDDQPQNVYWALRDNIGVAADIPHHNHHKAPDRPEDHLQATTPASWDGIGPWHLLALLFQ